MKRTDADGNVAGLYSDGNPETGDPATVVNASALNNIQEEIAEFIESRGIVLDGDDYTQLQQAIGLAVQDGAGFLSLNIGNNQIAAASLTGLLFNKTTEYGARALYHLHRRTATGGSEVVAVGQLFVRYLPGADSWDVTDTILCGDEHNVVFSITAGGQVQYTSDNIAGSSYVGEMRVSDMKKIRKV